MNAKRVRLLQDGEFKISTKTLGEIHSHGRITQVGEHKNGAVLYWMQRDQRANDNWALIFAQEKAIENNSSLIVVFNLVPDFLEATLRQYSFMMRGLQEVEKKLTRKNIPFKILLGRPEETLPKFIEENKCSILVSDFNPLKNTRIWKRDVAKNISIPFYVVDAHNIVPCLLVSQKVEFGAYTIRPKINRMLTEFLEPFSELKKMPPQENNFINDWTDIFASLNINSSISEVDWIKPGEDASHDILTDFLNNKLKNYAADRNDPNKRATSNLSPYLHFGQISAQRIALETELFIEYPESQKSFLEELIIRRELSDNFCYYNQNYYSADGFPDWAKKSIAIHQNDHREFIYSLSQFENAETNDPLWNAAQMNMVKLGTMHGYMRMYWAKKILEWTPSNEEAMKIAIYLNDKYQLDGRDPNGYTGIAWSIGGVHDRAWFDRPVFGKIRYMNYNGAKSKFDVKQYIQNIASL
ncbi:MAG: deoxyribodipyrimidine photo-lyase [Melioribacteraceae bacterium]|nr:deoxyribodipyrimidine photo-lyase [Melioribacteraceae bacterium]